MNVGRTGPYFHDGRYRTLEEVLAKSDGSMASTAKWSEADRLALFGYLRSL